MGVVRTVVGFVAKRAVGLIVPSPLGVAVGEAYYHVQRKDRRAQALRWAQQRAALTGLPLLAFGPQADLGFIAHPGPAVVVVDGSLDCAPHLEQAWGEVVRVSGNDLNNIFVIHSQPGSWVHRLAPGICNKITSAPPFGPWVARAYAKRDL